MIAFLAETFLVLGTLVGQLFQAFLLFFIPNPRKSVENERVLITGAGSGLGKLMAMKFARLGAEIVCLDINTQANEATAEEIRSEGLKAHSFQCDCSNREDIYRVADLVKEQIGDIDILVNNAGIVSGKKFMETQDWMIQKTFEVNTLAHCWTTKAFLPSMMTRNHGHIVSIASSAGLAGVAGLCDYCASKFGALGFDEALHMELQVSGKTGVHTTAVCPFFINTGMFDGVKTRFPSLLPILDPDWVTDKIINAVLRNQPIILLPRILYLFVWMKSYMPTSSFILLCRYFGVTTAMDEFKGRHVKGQ